MKKKSHLFRNIILFIISAIFLLSFSYYIYTTYSNIEMSSEYNISKISTSNNSISTTTNLDIPNMLEDVSNCVVGISKIKSHSTSIFSTSSSHFFMGYTHTQRLPKIPRQIIKLSPSSKRSFAGMAILPFLSIVWS